MSTFLQIAANTAADILDGDARWPRVPAANTLLDSEDATLLRLFGRNPGGAASDPPTMSDATYAHLKVGVIDLSNPSAPRYFGDQPHDKDTVTIGSTSKLAVAFAAFHLREDLRSAVRKTPSIDTMAKLKDGLKAYWDSAGKPAKLRAFANQPAKWPRIERMFELNGGQVDFAGWTDCGISEIDQDISPNKATMMRALEAYHDLEYNGSKLQRWRALLQNRRPDNTQFLADVPLGQPMPFGKWLWLMCKWSDNAAATGCFRDIGLDYQTVLMSEAGFYAQGAAQVGFHSASTYEGAWEVDKNTHVHEIDGLAISAAEKNSLKPYEELSRGGETNHSGSVRTLARFVIALTQGTLIDAANCAEMISLVRSLHYVRSGSNPLQVVAPAGPHFLGVGSYLDFSDQKSAVSFFGVRAVTTSLPPDADYYDFWSKLGIVIRDGEAHYSDVAFIDVEAGPDSYTSRRMKIGLILLNEKEDPSENANSPFERCARDILSRLARLV